MPDFKLLPDPVYLTSGVLKRVAAGDTALEGELLAIKQQGHPLLAVPKVKEQFFVGDPLAPPKTDVHPPSVLGLVRK